MRVTALFTAAGALVAAWVARGLDERFLRPHTPLAPLCVALAAAALVSAVVSERETWPRAVAYAFLGAARLAIPMVLTFNWVADGGMLWPALVVWIAVRDGWEGLVPKAPLVPVAMAITFVISWSADKPELAQAQVVLIAIVAGVAATWGAQRRAER